MAVEQVDGLAQQQLANPGPGWRSRSRSGCILLLLFIISERPRAVMGDVSGKRSTYSRSVQHRLQTRRGGTGSQASPRWNGMAAKRSAAHIAMPASPAPGHAPRTACNGVVAEQVGSKRQCRHRAMDEIVQAGSRRMRKIRAVFMPGHVGCVPSALERTTISGPSIQHLEVPTVAVSCTPDQHVGPWPGARRGRAGYQP